MNDKTQAVLASLAQKMGVTIEQLWGVMVKQAQISAVSSCVEIVLLTAFIFFVYRLHKQFSTENKDGYVMYDEGDGYGILMILLAVSCAVMVVVIACLVNNVVTALLNPRYWAIQQLMDALKG